MFHFIISLRLLEKLIDKPYGPFALDEIKRKAEKDYIEKCAAIQAADGPKEDFLMPEKYEHAVKINDSSKSKSKSKSVDDVSLESPKKLKRKHYVIFEPIHTFVNLYISCAVIVICIQILNSI